MKDSFLGTCSVDQKSQLSLSKASPLKVPMSVPERRLKESGFSNKIQFEKTLFS